jgi:Tfp pilus assembly protein PilF
MRRVTQGSLDETMELALAAYRAKRFAASRESCVQILAERADHAKALHLLAVIDMQAGNLTAAEVEFRAAIAADPKDPEFHNNLGVLLWKSGRRGEELACFRSAVELAPNYAAAP